MKTIPKCSGLADDDRKTARKRIIDEHKLHYLPEAVDYSEDEFIKILLMTLLLLTSGTAQGAIALEIVKFFENVHKQDLNSNKNSKNERKEIVYSTIKFRYIV
ncbi:unnamed protein product [Nesidiocoris tenuis]|uniref:Uncharacterized protein n=1 Tax=Nesidiocoris tenuis TaxID=355587 RepID=A0A6H5G114_9HEMI|nr:unnamed protein product [Nesidiocoris tenuis]